MSAPSLEYLAGVFDTKACVLVNKRRRAKDARSPYYFLQITLNFVDEGIVRAFQDRFGGSVAPVQGTHRWTATTRVAEAAVRALAPYLRSKRQQAHVALGFCDHVNGAQHAGRTLTRDAQAVRERFREELHLLNAEMRPSISRANWERIRD